MMMTTMMSDNTDVSPGAVGAPEVELAADFRVGSASVRNVVGVEGHHVTQHVRAACAVCARVSVLFLDGKFYFYSFYF